jgi:tetratricopeptide (TPR) repeat protein
MYFWVLLIASGTALFAGSSEQLALALRAQSDFERVEMAAAPRVADTVACIQSQAAAFPVAAPDDLSLLHFRKGYCTLIGATITRNAKEFSEAAAEFDKSIESWASRPNRGKVQPEPVPSGVRVLAAIARLSAGTDEAGLRRARIDISTAVSEPVCTTQLMPAAFCLQVTQAGRQWLGWIALKDDYVDDALRTYSQAGPSGWSAWAAGRRAFLDRNYKETAAQYRKAIDAWEQVRRQPAPSITDRLSPLPDLRSALTDLGGAYMLAGDAPDAIATLDRAVKENPANARAYYLRGRAKEAAGQEEQAMADYNLASRTAFASAKDLASGEAHFYRGILLFRRKDYARAEGEFASALNFDIPEALRKDAVAWRHLSAVADGSCSTSREFLERSLETASPYFPKNEARNLSASCMAAVGAGGSRALSVR